MKPKVTQKIAESGELQYVLHIAGEPFQAFSTLKAALCALITVMTMTGCATLERHPVATSIVGSVLVTSIALSSHHGDGHGPQMSEPLTAPDIGTPNCGAVSCK